MRKELNRKRKVGAVEQKKIARLLLIELLAYEASELQNIERC